LYQKKTVSIIFKTQATSQQIMKTASIPFILPEQDGRYRTLKELSKPALRANRETKEKKSPLTLSPAFPKLPKFNCAWYEDGGGLPPLDAG
jgi:hypothetical protein